MPDQIVTLENLANFSGQLGDQKIYDQVAFVVDFTTESYSSGESFRFLRKLEPILDKIQMDSELRNKYQALLLRLKFVALPMLEETEIVDLFKFNLLHAFQNGIDLQNRIRRLFPINDVARQDLSTKNALVQAIETNEQRIGTATVSNWVQEYKKTTGENAPGTLELVKFITENKSAVLLENNLKTLLKEVLSFYDWLRYRSIDVAGVLGINKEQQRPISAPLPKFTPPPKPVIESKPAPVIEKEMTTFEKKLAEVNVTKEPPHGEPASTRVSKDLGESTRGGDLEALKHRVEKAKIKEAPKPPVAKFNMDEINREVHTPELSAHKEMVAAKPKVLPKPVVPLAPKPAPRPAMPPKPKPMAPSVPLSAQKPIVVPRAYVPQAPSLAPIQPKPPMELGKPLTEINSMDDLKMIDVKHLRLGPVAAQLELIKTKIMTISKQSKVLPFYAVAAFEQSPLFRAYLAAGTAMVTGAKSELTQVEFEAVADLKKQIESL